MFGRRARAERRQQAEADRLFALADELAKQAGERPDYRREITAGRAARIRGELGKDLAQDARAQTAEPQLEGARLGVEIERLAEAFPEPEGVPGPDYRRSPAGSDEHRAAYAEGFTANGGAGYAAPGDVDLSYEIDNTYELAAERYYEDLAERHYRELGEDRDAPEAENDEPGLDAARWSPDAVEAEPDAGR